MVHWSPAPNVTRGQCVADAHLRLLRDRGQGTTVRGLGGPGRGALVLAAAAASVASYRASSGCGYVNVRRSRMDIQMPLISNSASLTTLRPPTARSPKLLVPQKTATQHLQELKAPPSKLTGFRPHPQIIEFLNICDYTHQARPSHPALYYGKTLSSTSPLPSLLLFFLPLPSPHLLSSPLPPRPPSSRRLRVHRYTIREH